MEQYLKFIMPAIQKNTNLEDAVDKTLNYFSNYNPVMDDPDELLINPCSDMDFLLEQLLSKASKNKKYLPIFDLLHKKHPQNVKIVVCQAEAWKKWDDYEFIKILSNAITLLHQQGDKHRKLPEYYAWLAEVYQELDEPEQALSACNMAISHFNPDYYKDTSGYEKAMEIKKYLE